MIRAIVDSGATRARWIFHRKRGKTHIVETSGINPFFFTEEEAARTIQQELEKAYPELKPWEVEELIFYGAGCSSEQRCMLIDRALRSVFSRARIIVHHDILGAARGVLGDQPGYVVILGTGSNTAYYNGREIVDRHGGHGYILNDEGSGADLGRHLIARWLDREMPEELLEAFDEFIGMTEAEVIYKVYQDKRSSLFLAQQAPFLKEHINHPWSQHLISSRFNELIKRHLVPLRQRVGQEGPIHTVGSIGYVFKDLWTQALEEYGFQAGQIVQSPIEGLAQYHWEKGKK